MGFMDDFGEAIDDTEQGAKNLFDRFENWLSDF